MPKGVTQDQVNAAIDALVAAGERPTIERVRAALGTGSPNTVARMLDVWWTTLHERLTHQQTKLAVPDAPDDVAVVATRLWQVALERAGEHAEQGVAVLRDALVRDRAACQERAATAEAVGAEADRARRAAESRLEDVQRLVDQQAAQLADVQRLRGDLERQVADLASQLGASQQALLAARAEAAHERTRLEAAHQAAEDRWLQEVDRARQEEAKSVARLQQALSVSRAAAEASAAELANAVKVARRYEQELARKDARIATLGEQFDRLHERLGKALTARRPNTPRRRTADAASAKKRAAPKGR